MQAEEDGVQHFLGSSEFVLGVSLFAEEMPPRATSPKTPSNTPQSSIPTLNPPNLVRGGTVEGVSSFLLANTFTDSCKPFANKIFWQLPKLSKLNTFKLNTFTDSCKPFANKIFWQLPNLVPIINLTTSLPRISPHLVTHPGHVKSGWDHIMCEQFLLWSLIRSHVLLSCWSTWCPLWPLVSTSLCEVLYKGYKVYKVLYKVLYKGSSADKSQRFTLPDDSPVVANPCYFWKVSKPMPVVAIRHFSLLQGDKLVAVFVSKCQCNKTYCNVYPYFKCFLRESI